MPFVGRNIASASLDRSVQSSRAQEVRVLVGKALVDLSVFDFCAFNVYRLPRVLMVFKLDCSVELLAHVCFLCTRSLVFSYCALRIGQEYKANVKLLDYGRGPLWHTFVKHIVAISSVKIGTIHGRLQSKRAQEVRVLVGKDLVDLSVFVFCAANVYRVVTGTYGFHA